MLTVAGELLLVDGQSSDYRLLSRLRLFEDEVEVWSHPALAAGRLYVRTQDSVCCFDLVGQRAT